MAIATPKLGDIYSISNAAVAAMPADDAAFEALTMVDIINVVTGPSYGSSTNKISQDYIGEDFTVVQEGYTRGMESSILVGIDASGDVGQTMLLTAQADSVGSYVVATTRLNGTVTYAWGIITDDEEAGGSGEEFDNRSHTFTQNAKQKTYTPA